MVSESNPFLDLVFIILCPFILSSPATFNTIAYARFLLGVATSIISYMAIISYISAYTFILSALFVAFCSLLQYLDGHTTCRNYILQRIEKQIRTQLSSLRKEERKVAKQIEAYLEAIKEWDTANADLMKQIRIAEHTIQKKATDWQPVPKRRSHPLTGGVTTWRRPAQEPSPSALVRWWRGQDHPEVFEAACDLDWIHARLRTVRATYHRFTDENDRLTEALREATAKKNAVKNLRDLDSFGNPYRYEREVAERKNQRRQQQQQQQQQQQESRAQPRAQPIWETSTRPSSWRLESAIQGNGEMLHVCHHCGPWHNWTYKYPTLAAAAASAFHGPCLAAQARLTTISWDAAAARFPATQPVLAPTNLFSAALPTQSLAPLFRTIPAAAETLPIAAPEPAPAPAPKVVAAPAPVPKAVTASAPAPKVMAAPATVPKVVAAPAPAPKAITAPAPIIKPVAAPAPAPKVVAAPAPAPKAVTAPAPAPKVMAAPAPAPKVVAAPAPAPKAVIAPAPAPKVMAAPATVPKVVAAPAPAPKAVIAPAPAPKVMAAPAPAPKVMAAPAPVPKFVAAPAPAPKAEAAPAPALAVPTLAWVLSPAPAAPTTPTAPKPSNVPAVPSLASVLGPATPPAPAGRSLLERSTFPSAAAAAAPAPPLTEECGLVSPTSSELERELAREEAEETALASPFAEEWGLVSPTCSELERELAREEAEEEEEEEEEERKGKKDKGKERMGREEEEELEREREMERAMAKYRQEF